MIVPTPVEDVVYVRDHYGLRDFNALYLWAGLLNPSKPETWQAQIDTWIAQLRTAMDAYRAAGVDKQAYVYGFDEATGVDRRVAVEQTLAGPMSYRTSVEATAVLRVEPLAAFRPCRPAAGERRNPVGVEGRDVQWHRG